MKNNRLAIFFMLLNCFLAASMATAAYFFKKIPTFSMISGYNFITFIFIFAILKYKKIPTRSPNLHLSFIRSLLNTIAYYLYFKALTLTSIANVAVISYTDPILTCLAAFLILKEKITRIQIIELIIGFICALIIINPTSINFDKGSALVLCANCFWALSNITMKKMGETENELLQIFWVSLITTFVAASLAFVRKESLAITPFFFKAILLLGALALIQYYSIYKALTLAPAGVTMPFFFTTLIFASIYGYFCFNQIQNSYELIGSCILIAMNIWQLYIIKAKK